MLKLTRDSQYIRSVYLKRDLISSYNHFPFNLPVIQNFQELSFHPNVTYIIGENGMGKSTLLEGIAIALGFNPEGGTLNFNFSNYDSHLEIHCILIRSSSNGLVLFRKEFNHFAPHTFSSLF